MAREVEGANILLEKCNGGNRKSGKRGGERRNNRGLCEEETNKKEKCRERRKQPI